MSLKEKVNELLKQVGLTADEIKMAQMKLEDGMTVIEADSFEAGMPVMIVNDGEMVPMPIGEYTLEDGRILVVEEVGMIKEIKEAQAEEVAPDAVPAEAETTEMETQSAKKIVESIIKESFFSEMDTLKAENTALKAEIEKLKLSAETEVLEATETVVEVEPTVEPIAFIPEQPKQEVKFKFGRSGESTINRILNQLNK
jgi:hypothetical protein